MVSTWLLSIFAKLVGLMSWRCAQKTGALLGLLWFHGLRIRRKIVLDNLALALPDRHIDHIQIARKTYIQIAISALEFFKMTSMKDDEVLSYVKITGLHHFEVAEAKNKGVIVTTGHFGNFDLLACAQAMRGVSLGIVTKELHHQGSNHFWMEARRRTGLQIFAERDGPKKILPWIRAGKVLGLVVDQRTSPNKGGILAHFMGQQVWTSTAAARLSIRTGAPIIPARMERQADGTHKLIIEPAIDFSNENIDQDTLLIQKITERINQTLEQWIKTRPEHWMWLHRRFLDVYKSTKEEA